MKQIFKKVTTLTIILTVLISNIAFAYLSSETQEGAVVKLTAYDCSVSLQVDGNDLWQSGKIILKNQSTTEIRNWVIEFESNRKINALRNVKYSVTELNNGNYYYKVEAASWQKWYADRPWTHRNAVISGEEISISIAGNSTNNINGIKLTNVVISDMNKDPIIVREWSQYDNNSYNVYKTSNIVMYKNEFYVCRQSHVVYAFNWSPEYAHSLWMKIKVKLISSN